MKLTEVYNWRKDQLIILEREERIAKKISEADFSVPAKFSVANLGKSYIRIFVYPENENGARILASEFGDMFKLVWKIDIRDYEGKFFYRGEKKDCYAELGELSIIIENAPTPANCKIVKKIKKVACFEKVCSQE